MKSDWDKLWEGAEIEDGEVFSTNADLTLIKAVGDRLKEKSDELDFIRRNYGDALPASLTRDALKLKIAVLEQKRKEALKLIPDICLFGDCDFAPMSLTGDTPDNYCYPCPVRKLHLILSQDETT